jgi:hypothetical protein
LFDVPWSGGNEVLLATLTEADFPLRLVNAMRAKGVVLVGEFVQQDEATALRAVGLGRGSLSAAKRTLECFGLHLGQTLSGWDSNLAHQARKASGRRIQQRIFEMNPQEWANSDSLEDELMALLKLVEEGRNADILFQLYGFDGQAPKTLDSVGQVYGLTRERVRQISARAERRLSEIWRPMPYLDLVKDALLTGIRRPFTQVEFAACLAMREVSKVDFHIEGALRAFELIGERIDLTFAQIGGVRVYGRASEVAGIKPLLKLLRRETSASGCTSTQRLALLVGLTIDDAPRVRDLLLQFSEVAWLDRGKNWLLSSRPSRNRLANVASRVFSVAKSVEINELRAALLRPNRVTFVPPEEPLAAFLEYHRIAKVQDRIAIVDPELAPTELGVNDLGLALAFDELGSPVTREQLEDYCLDDLGMNTNSFYMYLTYSPLVVKLASGVFSLVGKDVGPGTIDQLKIDIKKRQFESSYGWSKAGTLWWHFRLDRPTINSGTHLIPTFVLNLSSGDWNVKTLDNLDLGPAKVDNGFISGLKVALSILGAIKEDYVQIDFDIATRVFFVRIVGDEPTEFSRKTESDEFDDFTLADDED